MARDVGKTIKEAERLLKQRRADKAATQLRRLWEHAGKDSKALNKIGDLLLQAGATDDAMACFGRLAEQFIDEGFLPKAIAIYKKALRAAPDHPQALLRLGELYLKQKLTGEAAGHLERAVALNSSFAPIRGTSNAASNSPSCWPPAEMPSWPSTACSNWAPRSAAPAIWRRPRPASDAPRSWPRATPGR
jgi:tetratricopeptide (TPR) repeat protein